MPKNRHSFFIGGKHKKAPLWRLARLKVFKQDPRYRVCKNTITYQTSEQVLKSVYHLLDI